MENKTKVAKTRAFPTPRPPAAAPKAPRPAAPRHKPLTPKEVKAGIETSTQKFRNSTRFHSLTAFFEQGQKTNITQCICLGLGPFMNFESKSARGRKRNGDFNTSLHQPAMLESLPNGLTKDEETKIYFQDPVFTRSERDHLQSRDLKAKNISRALTDTFPALYIGTDPDAAIADIGKDNAKKIPGGKEKYIRPLQEFGRDSAETLRLPIFAHGVRDGHDVWAEASVHWRVPDGGGEKVGKRLGGGGMARARVEIGARHYHLVRRERKMERERNL
ncbi:hypothetical protein HO133_003464 [Letharia lupina]|uniref:SRR1-like domain-containing protein n=1 Tax=Letharia lupina TaxID=560253 RepID=A0A8H6CBD6_9LECA|nr:uncharacterized protein HO133_003464 [Letharia lupina]KAF6220332.1 hypothetical protein HO133_003464 [Letharia lupina]